MSALIRRVIIPIGCLLLIGACARDAFDEEAMMPLASNLPAIADAVDAFVEAGAPPDVDGPLLVKAATSHDPTMLEPFENFYVTARREKKFTSVLVCDSQRTHALFEDTACTSRFDSHLWRDTPGAACEFQLDLSALCK